MKFRDPSINDEINAIFANKEIWSVEPKFKVALRTVLSKLYKRGYSKEALSIIYVNLSLRRMEMVVELSEKRGYWILY